MVLHLDGCRRRTILLRHVGRSVARTSLLQQSGEAIRLNAILSVRFLGPTVLGFMGRTNRGIATGRVSSAFVCCFRILRYRDGTEQGDLATTRTTRWFWSRSVQCGLRMPRRLSSIQRCAAELFLLGRRTGFGHVTPVTLYLRRLSGHQIHLLRRDTSRQALRAQVSNQRKDYSTVLNDESPFPHDTRSPIRLNCHCLLPFCFHLPLVPSKFLPIPGPSVAYYRRIGLIRTCGRLVGSKVSI